LDGLAKSNVGVKGKKSPFVQYLEPGAFVKPYMGSSRVYKLGVIKEKYY